MNEIIEILNDIRPDLDIDESSKLISDKLLDSLDFIRLVSEIEIEMGVSIPAEELLPENLDTITQIEKLIKNHM